MTAAIYARKSTDQTGVADADRSVTRQIAHARAYADEKGWRVADAHVYVDDGISGAEFAKRPGFLRLMNALKPRPPFQVLVMSEESRLGRESIETAYALKQLVQAGVRVFFYMEDRERTLDSPTDKIMLSLTAFADELEREKARQRTFDAMRRKAEAGHVTGGRVFGYDNVRTEAGPVTRVVNDAEADVVRQIYASYAAGNGLRAIAHQLNEEGARCPRAQQGRPHGWAPSSVREVIHRPLYRGEIVWNKTRKRNGWGQVQQQERPEEEWMRRAAPELRIVSEDLGRAVDARLDRNSTQYLRTTGGRLWGRPSGTGESKYLLVGLSTCGVCGGGMSVRSRSHGRVRAYYYVCTAYHTRGRSVCENGYDLPMGATNDVVLETIGDRLLSPDIIQAAIERAAEQMQDQPVDGTADILRSELASVETELERLTAAIAAGADLASMVKAVKEREARRKTLAAQLAASEVAAQWPKHGHAELRVDLEARLKDWRGLFGRHVGQTRQLLRKLLVGRLMVMPDVRQEGRFARITGTGTLEPLVRGLCPSMVASPTGFEPVS